MTANHRWMASTAAEGPSAAGERPSANAERPSATEKSRSATAVGPSAIDESHFRPRWKAILRRGSQAIVEVGLTGAYYERAAYQQNDYIGWIVQAKRPETRQKRLNQMLDELRRGGVYMKIDHPPSRRS